MPLWAWLVVVEVGYGLNVLLAYRILRKRWRNEFGTWTTEDRRATLLIASLGGLLTVGLIVLLKDDDSTPAKW